MKLLNYLSLTLFAVMLQFSPVLAQDAAVSEDVPEEEVEEAGESKLPFEISGFLEVTVV